MNCSDATDLVAILDREQSSAALQTIIDFSCHDFAMRRVAHVIVAGWNLEHRQTTLHKGLPTPPLPF
jgi:hypothetical protein